MDFVTALCLSVPPSAALYFGVRAAVHKWDVLSTTRNVAVGGHIEAATQVVSAAVLELQKMSKDRASELAGLAATVIDETVHAAHDDAKRARERSRVAEKYARKTALLVAKIEADAAIQCARYSARVIRPKPPKEPMKPVTAHDRWLAGDGRKLPESVRDQVEWAVGRLRGTESDEQGDEEDAVSILDSLAPGLAESTKDEVRRAAGATA